MEEKIARDLQEIGLQYPDWGKWVSQRILIVDDERDLVEGLGVRLESLGYDILKAYDGADALEKVQGDPPDLILLDVRMPKLDGFQVCRLIKSQDNLKTIKIVMLTAKGSAKDQETGRAMGADDYIVKPFVQEDLIKKVQTLLGGV